jgi:hypothetical protein
MPHFSSRFDEVVCESDIGWGLRAKKTNHSNNHARYTEEEPKKQDNRPHAA